MMSDLAAADAAGDTQLAQHIAGLIKSSRGAVEPSEFGIDYGAAGKDIRETVGAAGQHALKSLTFGHRTDAALASLLSPSEDPVSYSQARKEMLADDAKASQAHPIASAVGGMAPSLLVPGAAFSTLPRALATGAAMGAVQGVTDEPSDDPAAMATAAGTGAGTGAGFSALGAVAPKVASATGSALKSAANSLAARTLKGTAGDYRALGKEGVQNLGDFLLGRGAVKFGSTQEAVASRIPALEQETGQQVGRAVDALDQTGAQVSKRDLANRLLALADEAKARGPGAAPVVAKYQREAQTVLDDIMLSGEPMMSFEQAEKWKRGYQAPINYSKANNTPLEMGSKEVASASRQGVEDAAAVADPATAAAFTAAKKESGLAQDAARMATGAEGRREARGMLGPIAKGVSWTAAALSAMHGNIPGAVGALAAGPTLQAVARRAPAAAAVTFNKGAQLADKIAWMAMTSPGRLGRYGGILSSIVNTGGLDALAAHLFVIGQTDPSGSDELRKRAEAE